MAGVDKTMTLTDDAMIHVETRLRAYLRRRVEPAAVGDLLGEVLLRMVQHRDDLEAATNPWGWLYRVAANTVTDHYRRRAAERRALGQVGSDPSMPAADAIGREAVAAAELADCLVPMIRTLPARYAEALLLTDIEGLTQAAAAKRLGLSLSGMKSRVQRGRRLLKRTLLRCCEVELDRRGGVVDYHPRGQRRNASAKPPVARGCR